MAYVHTDRIIPAHGASWGGGPDAVAEAACWDSHRSRVRTPLWPLSLKKNVSYPRTCKDSVLWEPP